MPDTAHEAVERFLAFCVEEIKKRFCIGPHHRFRLATEASLIQLVEERYGGVIFFLTLELNRCVSAGRRKIADDLESLGNNPGCRRLVGKAV